MKCFDHELHFVLRKFLLSLKNCILKCNQLYLCGIRIFHFCFCTFCTFYFLALILFLLFQSRLSSPLSCSPSKTNNLFAGALLFPVRRRRSGKDRKIWSCFKAIWSRCQAELTYCFWIFWLVVQKTPLSLRQHSWYASRRCGKDLTCFSYSPSNRMSPRSHCAGSAANSCLRDTGKLAIALRIWLWKYQIF